MNFCIHPLPANGARAIWFIFNHDKVMHREGELPAFADNLALTLVRFIGNLGPSPCYVAELVGEAPPDVTWQTMRQTLLGLPAPYQQALTRAWQLLHFERRYRYCAHCANPLSAHDNDNGKTCRSCGAVYYPHLSPAIMVAIVRGHEILLARSPHFTEGLYSALAGFVEPGETLEASVHREVMEEVGIQIEGLSYAGSQQWPFPHSLMVAFQAHYVSGDIVPQPEEIADARWFDINQLPLLPPKASIAHWLIQHTVAKLKKQREGA